MTEPPRWVMDTSTFTHFCRAGYMYILSALAPQGIVLVPREVEIEIDNARERHIGIPLLHQVSWASRTFMTEDEEWTATQVKAALGGGSEEHPGESAVIACARHRGLAAIGLDAYPDCVYFTYVDETGLDGKSPCLVMVGIVADAQRLHRTQEEIGETVHSVSESARRRLKELKSNELLRGLGPWRGVSGDDRKEVVTKLCGWVVARKHSVALAAIDLKEITKSPPPAEALNEPWLAAAMHVVLQLQRFQQQKSANKGRTVLIFDDNKKGLDGIADLVADPPSM